MIFLASIAVCALIVAAGAAYQAAGSARDARRYPAPGKLIDVGGHRLHIHAQGEGKPAVVLEAGIAASSLSWQLVQPEIAKFATVCSYDRAGLGWSESAGRPPLIEHIQSDLRALLRSGGIPMPVVLVGHSFGGLVALDYACKHRSEVAGLVLVDPLVASEWTPVSDQSAAMLRRGIRLSRRGAWVARLGVVRLSLDLLRAGSRRIPKLAARLSSGRGSELTERLVGEVRKLPRELWPVVQAHWCQPKCFLAMADHLESLPVNAAACITGCDLDAMPLIVLSAENSTTDRKALHESIAARSSAGKIIIAAQSGHWIQLDEPQFVVAAVREVVEAAR